MDQQKQPSVFHSFTTKRFFTLPVVAVFLFVVVAGGFGGYFLANFQATKTTQSATTVTSAQQIQAGAVYGSDDTKTFSDMAEGTVTAGGINGEGQYHLVRPGGDSQNVYMTSSLVDLSLFIGRKVKVWGQTQKAQTAGWLMDVGRIQVE